MAVPRPPVSEAVVDLEDEVVERPTGDEKRGARGAYLIPIAFSAIALALIIAAILSGVNLAVFGK